MITRGVCNQALTGHPRPRLKEAKLAVPVKAPAVKQARHKVVSNRPWPRAKVGQKPNNKTTNKEDQGRELWMVDRQQPLTRPRIMLQAALQVNWLTLLTDGLLVP